jgi:hypothetical protein
MYDFLRLVRVSVATVILAVACTLSPAAAQDSQGQTVTDQSPTGELTYWNGIKDSNDLASFKTYLKNFPNGMFYDVALAKYQALGGNVADVKPAANSNVNHKDSAKTLSSGTTSVPKVKNIIFKKPHVPMAQKKVARYQAQKRTQTHLVKKTYRKHIAIKSKYIAKRKSIAPPREGGGGSGGGGGGGSGSASHW